MIMMMNTTDLYNTTTIYENNTTTKPPRPSINELWYWRVGLFAVGGACIECVGVICNIIAIIVLANFRSSSSAPFLLICLSVFDSIYLLVMFFLEGLNIMVGDEMISSSYLEFSVPVYGVLFPTPFVMQTCAIYLVVVITLERFAVVTWPFVAHRFCSIKSARIAVAAVVLFGILYHVPMYKAYHIRSTWDNRTQMWEKTIVPNAFGNSTFYKQIYITWTNITVNFALPFVLLAVFNYLMIISLRKTRANVPLRRAFTMEERRLTFMVICMTSVFFFCELMAAINKIVLIGYTTYFTPPPIFRFSAIADTCLLLNAAVNFAIYCVSGRKFRHTFVVVFCQCRNKLNTKQPFTITAESKHDHSKGNVNSCFIQTRKHKRSTTESSLSSISNGTRSSKCTSSDSIPKKLSVKTTEGE